ncbi:MAG: DUF2244 domain-containing protein [Pseudomonadota bacterium]
MTEQREWISKRNCSISPRQMLLAYGALCGISLAVGSFFAWHGAWYVLGFALLEMTAVGTAFVLHGRHATDLERVALKHDCLVVELIRAEQARQFRFDPRVTKVQAPAAYHCLIGVEARGTRVEIGRFLPSPKRQQFAHELRTALAG